MNCPKCGAATSDGQSFCGECGSAVASGPVPVAPPPPGTAADPGFSTATSSMPAAPQVAYQAGPVRFSDPVTGRPLADWWRRVVALLIDGLVLLIPILIIWALTIKGAIVTSTNPLTNTTQYTFHYGSLFVGWLLISILELAYFTLLVGRPKGQSVGMMVMRFDVRAAESDAPLGYGRAFVRYLAIALFGIIWFVELLNYLWPLWDRRRQALHDKVARSVVVDLR